MAGLCEDWETEPLTLSDSHKDWFTRLHSSLVIAVPAAQQKAVGLKKAPSSDSHDVALGWVGLAAVQVAEGKWKEAKESIERGKIIKMNVG